MTSRKTTTDVVEGHAMFSTHHPYLKGTAVLRLKLEVDRGVQGDWRHHHAEHFINPPGMIQSTFGITTAAP